MIELLEQRTLLTGSPYAPLATVADSDNTSDNNLRSAIAAANADTTADTINLSAGTYALTLGELNFDPTTAHSLTIVGNASSGPDATIIDQLSLDRVFQIAAGDSVTFQNLEITGGVATDFPGFSAGSSAGGAGGGILSAGNLTLNNVVVTGNKAIGPATDTTAAGGGIVATAGLTIQDSVISNNSAIAGPGSSQGSAYSYGGGLYINSSSAVSITNTVIAANSSLGGSDGGGGLGGGAYVSDTAGTTTKFTDDTITGNQAVGGAGRGRQRWWTRIRYEQLQRRHDRGSHHGPGLHDQLQHRHRGRRQHQQ